jgi:hypothetical protein
MAVAIILPSSAYSIDPSPFDSATISIADGPSTPAASIHITPSAPVIDGVMDSVWTDATEHGIQHLVYGSVESPSDSSGEWKAMWDSSALYYFVRVFDDQLVKDSGEPWNDDYVDIYLDPDHSGLFDYDRVNDAQYVFRWDDRMVYTYVSRQLVSSGAGIEFMMVRNPDGYSAEIAIPWATLGVTPVAGKLMGMEVGILDDDDGGEADAKVQWFGPRNRATFDPNTYATVVLSDSSNVLPLSTQFVKVVGTDLVVFPGLNDSGTPTVYALNTNAEIHVADDASVIIDKPGGGLMDLPPVTFGARSKLSLVGSGAKLLRLPELTLSQDAVLDLADNDLIVRNGNLSAITSAIKSSRLIGKGETFISLAAVLNKMGDGKTRIMYTFGGQNVGLTDVLVKYTWNGDANLDGVINADDYFLIDSGYITQAKGYQNGDFNYDDVINADDYFLIDSAYIGQSGPLAASKSEPAVSADVAVQQPAKKVNQDGILSQLFSTEPVL